MQRSHVIHRGRPAHDQGTDRETTFHICHGETQVRLQTSMRLPMKLRDFEFLATKGVHHPNGAQSFLRLREQRTLLFLDSGGLRANAFGKKIDCAEEQGNDGKGKQR